VTGATVGFVPSTLGTFRTAEALNSSEPAQLRRTIAELEERIAQQDVIIENQYHYILSLESGNAAPPQPRGDRDTDRLQSEVTALQGIQDSLEEQFKEFLRARVDSLNQLLGEMDRLPDRPETRAVYAKIKREGHQIQRNRARGGISPMAAITQISELEREAVAILTNQPKITFARSDQYRAEILIHSLGIGHKTISTQEAITILMEAENRTIHREQAIRAMRWAVTAHPDKVQLVKRGPKQKITICKTETGGPQ
jgi:hypothetical protein